MRLSRPTLFFAGLLSLLLLLQSGWDPSEGETGLVLSRALASGELSLEKKPYGPYLRGEDGRWWLAQEYLAPLLGVPSVWLGDRLPLPPGPSRNEFVHLFQAMPGALVAALMGLLLFLFAARRLKVDERTAMAAALLGVFASMLLPYSRGHYDGSLSGLFLLLGMYLGTGEGRRRALLAGLCLGLACLARSSTLLAALPVGLLVVFAAEGKERWVRLGWVAFAAFFPMSLVLVLNALRLGSPLASAVSHPGFANNNAFVAPFAEGFTGLLFSPGKGLLFHAPLVLLAPFGFLLARRRDLFLASLGALFLLLLLHAKVRNWSGHWAWGPRYLIPALPLLLAGLGPLLSHRLARWGTMGVGLVSLVAAFLPVLVSWPQRIVLGAGRQEKAWDWDSTQLASHLKALGELGAGRCPRISSFESAPCALDLWWAGYASGHGTLWPLVLAGLLLSIGIGCLAGAFLPRSPGPSLS